MAELVRLCEPEKAPKQTKVADSGLLFAAAAIGNRPNLGRFPMAVEGTKVVCAKPRELGKPRTTVQRDMKIAAIAPSARKFSAPSISLTPRLRRETPLPRAGRARHAATADKGAARAARRRRRPGAYRPGAPARSSDR
jgi:hypothetical protein